MKPKKVKLDLVGLDGNAYAVLGAFKRAAITQGFESDWVENVLKEATSGDYEHLLSTIEAHRPKLCPECQKAQDTFVQHMEEYHKGE